VSDQMAWPPELHHALQWTLGAEIRRIQPTNSRK
jgi:hypothetical protein